MKNILLILCFALLFSCKSKKPDTEIPKEKGLVVMNIEEVDPIKKNRAYDLGKRLLDACNTSNFKVFSKNEATEKVIQNATKERISSTCKKMNLRNGKFISINLIDVVHDEINEEYIFRYNIDYEKKYFKRELTVKVNAEDKVSSISTKEVKPKPM